MVRALVHLFVIVGLTACSEDAPGHDGKPSIYDELDFFGLLTLGGIVDYEPFQTVPELGAESDLIVTGRIIAAREGRIPVQDGFTAQAYTVVEIELSEVAAGPTEDRAFVEFTHSRVVESHDLNQRVPKDVLLFFLKSTPALPVKGTELRRGIPDGETLHYLTLESQSVIREASDHIEFPMDNVELAPHWEHETLEDVLAELE